MCRCQNCSFQRAAVIPGLEPSAKQRTADFNACHSQSAHAQNAHSNTLHFPPSAPLFCTLDRDSHKLIQFCAQKGNPTFANQFIWQYNTTRRFSLKKEIIFSLLTGGKQVLLLNKQTQTYWLVSHWGAKPATSCFPGWISLLSKNMLDTDFSFNEKFVYV